MDTEFIWIIEKMKCAIEKDGISEVVITAFWRCNAINGNHLATAYGSCDFIHSGSIFTPYNQLTQNQVLDWCWNNGIDKDSIENSLQLQMQEKINPSVVTLSNPWNNS